MDASVGKLFKILFAADAHAASIPAEPDPVIMKVSFFVLRTFFVRSTVSRYIGTQSSI